MTSRVLICCGSHHDCQVSNCLQFSVFLSESIKGEDGTHMIREPLTNDEKAIFEGYAAAIFSRMGMNLDTPGTHMTPERWLTALWDMTEGYDGDAKLSTLFPVEFPVWPDEVKT